MKDHSAPPVLLIIFNRPDPVRKLIGSLSGIAPSRLYIAADGPRPGVLKDEGLCAEARAIALDISWPCEVRTLFSDTNLGVDPAVERAIKWFFESETEGIILEDDCIPHHDFFRFVAEMLEKFRENERVMIISGDNFQDGALHGDGSYYFSRYASTWGWATWKRAWDLYDSRLSSFPEFVRAGKIGRILGSRKERHFWRKYFRKLHAGIYHAWDAKWMFAIWDHDGVCIVPNKNLVSNVGTGPDATHTREERITLPVQPLAWPLVHPDAVKLSPDADSYLFKRNYFVPLHTRIAARFTRV